MRVRFSAVLLAATALIGTVAASATPISAHPGPEFAPAPAPGANLSTSGDYATDTFGDPWDFENDEDVPPISMVGCEPASCQISRDGAPGQGTLHVVGGPGTIIKLVRSWGLELPWGRDGEAHPIDAATYSRLTLSTCPGTNMGITFVNEAGQNGFLPIYPSGCSGNPSYDLSRVAGWTGRIISLNILFGDQGGNMTLDWVRLHRPGTSDTPTYGIPVARTLSPNEEGGTDYATANGNAWNFDGPQDVLSSNDIVNATYANGYLAGQTLGNDSYVEFALPTPFNSDKFHRFTAKVCFDGAMSFANAPGGGMVARVAWFGDRGAWTESQDFIVYPGCNPISLDLATTPAVAVNDEASVAKAGWRGQRITRLRFDLNEDPGRRNFTLRQVKFADDAAFSDSYGIQYQDIAGAGRAVADIYATTNRGAFDGVQIASGAPVDGGNINTFGWKGTDTAGRQLPNGTYWIYTVIRNGAGSAVNYSSGPVRLQRAVPSSTSSYVPLSPTRLLDTRDGTGGNITALGSGWFTELGVVGHGGVPGDATAVVMNVTVDAPNASGFVTAWPSDEGQPVVSSLNFNPGQTVPNLVTVKLGANGKVNLFNSNGSTHLVADVVGYYTPNAQAAGRFTALTPGRILDTGFANSRIAPGQTINVKVTGDKGVPASGVSGVALNVTVDATSASSFLTVYPTGEGRPTASSLNWVGGLTTSNLVLAKVGAGGQVSMFNYDGQARLIADVVGYFSASGGLFVPVAPQRIVDTRSGIGVPVGQVGQGVTLVAPVAGAGPVPPNATAVVANVTSDASTAQSYLTVYPTGGTQPTASSLNPRVGVPVPNQAYVKLGVSGRVNIFNYAGSTDVIVDVFGYVV